MKILLAAATAAEIGPALKHWGLEAEQAAGKTIHAAPYSITVCITGGGMVPATFALTQALLTGHYDFVLQAGIGGSFDQSIPLGSLVAIRSERLGDTGAEDHAQFIDLFDLGFADKNEAPFQGGQLINPLTNIPFPLPELIVDGITISTVSGHAPTIEARQKAFRPTTESMEGAALHYVGLQLNIPFLQVRTISNYVTPRDRSSWQIGKAVKTLNDQLITWLGNA